MYGLTQPWAKGMLSMVRPNENPFSLRRLLRGLAMGVAALTSSGSVNIDAYAHVLVLPEANLDSE